MCRIFDVKALTSDSLRFPCGNAMHTPEHSEDPSAHLQRTTSPSGSCTIKKKKSKNAK